MTAGHAVDYQYSARLKRHTVRHPERLFIIQRTLQYRIPGRAPGQTLQNSIFLYNTATLYPGIDSLFERRGNIRRAETGQNTDTLQGNAGLTLVPNPELNVNLIYNITSSSSVGRRASRPFRPPTISATRKRYIYAGNSALSVRLDTVERVQ